MALRSGIGGQLGMVAESTYGTFVTPTRFLEFNSEGLQFTRDTIRSAGIRRGSTVQRTGRWAVNRKGGGGPTAFEVPTKAFGLVLKHALGAVVITTPGGGTLTRLHTHTLGDLDDLSLTMQKGAPDVNGTTRAFTFLGCVCTEWEMSLEVDGLLMFNPTWDAQDMSTAQALATASFAAADELYSYQQVAVTVDAGAEIPTSVSFTGSNALKTDRYYIRANHLKGRPLIAERRELGGTLTFEFESMVQVNRFLNAAPGAEISVAALATGDIIEGALPYHFGVTAPKCKFDGEIPVIGGPDVLTVSAPFEILDDGTNPPITVTYQTTDTAS